MRTMTSRHPVKCTRLALATVLASLAPCSFAWAQAYAVVEIIGDHYSKTTLYGAPFSIG